jgi:hypothetical protein
MTVYIPYNLYTMNNVENAYPEVAVYSLNRTLEYSFKAFDRFVNVWALDTAVPAVSGFVFPNVVGTAAYPTWTTTPAITATRLYVEHITLHRDLQQMMALNPHAYLIRQYYRDTETLSDRVLHEIAVTKIIESVYMICNYNRNTTPGTAIVPGAIISYILVPAPLTVPVVHPVDPFYLPVNTIPLTGITISARGQNFYSNVSWCEFSQVWQFLFGKCDNSSTANHCLAQFTFGLWYYQLEHTGTYNSGWGPNLRIAWTASAFSTTWPGTLTILLQCINMVLAYRGALTVRYT